MNRRVTRILKTEIDSSKESDIESMVNEKLENMAIDLPEFEPMVFSKITENSNMTSTDKRTLKTLFEKYRAAWSSSKFDSGLSNICMGRIELKDENFTSVEPERPLKPGEAEIADKLIKELLEHNIIEQAQSIGKHCSNLIFVAKKQDKMESNKADTWFRRLDGKTRAPARVCLDLRKINRASNF